MWIKGDCGGWLEEASHQDDDSVVVLEPVHLYEELVNDRCGLIAARLGSPRRTQGVEFVDKEDRGSVVAHLFKRLSDPPGADSSVDVEKVRPRADDREKGQVGFKTRTLAQTN